jgi:2-haloacid dehalogenase
MAAVVFDALGTLFDLEPLREQLGAAVQEAWFERLLHSAVSLTAAGEWAPFNELAKSTLRTTLGRLEPERPVDEKRVLRTLGELPPYEEARDALELLAGRRVLVLTNGGREDTEKLLAHAGLADCVDRVFSVEEVRAYKPHRRAYSLVPADSILVAAHAWDVVGATAARLDAIWIEREGEWPLPEPWHGPSAENLLEAASMTLGGG